MDFVAIDFETANHNRSSACSIGIAVVKNSEITETQSYFIHPTPNYYSPINKQINHLSEKDTDSAPTFLELWESKLKDLFVGHDIVAHNAPFEKSVLNALSEVYGIDIPTDNIYCSLAISRSYLDLVNYTLDNVCSSLGIRFCHHHDAKADAIGCAEIILNIAQINKKDSLEELSENIYTRREAISKESLFDTDNQQQLQNYSVDEDAVKGKVFCFTGTLTFIQRDIAKTVIENAGGIFKNSISSKVNYLVVGDLSQFGDGYESGKLKKVREYRDKGCNIEILTEEQFQEMVVYEGPKITKEAIDYDSRSFLESNTANALYGKGICLSEGFPKSMMSQLALLGVHMGPTHYEDEAILTDYYIISNSVLSDMYDRQIKSPSVLRMESALKKQLEPEAESETGTYHRIKCISEDTILEFLKRRKNFEREVAEGIEPKSMNLK